MESLSDFSDELINDYALENITLAKLMKYCWYDEYECVNTKIIFDYETYSFGLPPSPHYAWSGDINVTGLDDEHTRHIIEDLERGNIYNIIHPKKHDGFTVPYPYDQADSANHYDILSKDPVIEEFMQAARLLIRLRLENKSVYEFGRMLKDAHLSKFWMCIINLNVTEDTKDNYELPEVEECYNAYRDEFVKFYQTGVQPSRERFMSFFMQEKYIEHWKERFLYTRPEYFAKRCVDVLCNKYLDWSIHVSYLLKSHDETIKDLSQKLDTFSRSFDGIELTSMDKAVMIRRRVSDLSSHISNETLAWYIIDHKY